MISALRGSSKVGRMRQEARPATLLTPRPRAPRPFCSHRMSGAPRHNWLMVAGGFEVRVACGEDTDFVREMARHAATLEDRPLPAPEGADVTDLLPGLGDVTVVAVAAHGKQLGAA